MPKARAPEASLDYVVEARVSPIPELESEAQLPDIIEKVGSGALTGVLIPGDLCIGFSRLRTSFVTSGWADTGSKTFYHPVEYTRDYYDGLNEQEAANRGFSQLHRDLMPHGEASSDHIGLLIAGLGEFELILCEPSGNDRSPQTPRIMPGSVTHPLINDNLITTTVLLPEVQRSAVCPGDRVMICLRKYHAIRTLSAPRRGTTIFFSRSFKE